MNKLKLIRVSIISTFVFIIALLTPFYQQKAMAYSNSGYFQDVKVGLQNITAPSLTAKLTGVYTLNGQALASGTVLTIKITNGKININGTEYASVALVPSVSTNIAALSNGTNTYNYMGSFSFIVNGSNVYPINSLPMENYLKGVVGYEMSDYFPIEALKTQAVAARTYALKHKGELLAKGYDFDDTTNYQVYYGYNPSFTNVIKAVDDTKGLVVTYNDTLIDAVFSASHGGYTEDVKNVWGSSVPYLISKVDSLNGVTIDNGDWTLGNKIYTNADIDSKLTAKGFLSSTDTFVKLDLNSITRYVSGRVSSVNVVYKDQNGVTNTKALTGDKNRTYLSLQSSMWNVSYDSASGTYTFSGKGYGHGLGMSQIGAKQRASYGQTYDQILKFYYNGTAISQVQ